MRRPAQLKRFENRTQLLRHIAAETGADIDRLWAEHDEQLNG